VISVVLGKVKPVQPRKVLDFRLAVSRIEQEPVTIVLDNAINVVKSVLEKPGKRVFGIPGKDDDSAGH